MEKTKRWTPEEVKQKHQEWLVAEACLKLQQENDLKKIPGEYGFASMTDFIRALIPLADSPIELPSKLVAKKGSTRKRNTITTETREAILSDLKEAKLSSAKIAAKHNVSTPTVNNIKKNAGLVKAKKQKPSSGDGPTTVPSASART